MFWDFFPKLSAFYTDWLIFEGLATKLNLNQNQKNLKLLGTKHIF
jgi:hypothetical protein